MPLLMLDGNLLKGNVHAYFAYHKIQLMECGTLNISIWVDIITFTWSESFCFCSASFPYVFHNQIYILSVSMKN